MHRIASFGDDMRHCVDFYPSGADVSLILQVILTQSLPQIFWHFDVCYVPFFLKSLPAQAILWFYDSSPSFSGSWWTHDCSQPQAINSSASGHQCHNAHLGGRCRWCVLPYHHCLLPFWREWEEEDEGSACWASHDPASARVKALLGRWLVDRLWGSVKLSNEVIV